MIKLQLEEHTSDSKELEIDSRTLVKNERNRWYWLIWLLQKREFGVLIALLLISTFFAITNPLFLTTANLLRVLRQTAVLGIIAVAMTILITGGEFDLSVGSTYALNGIICGVLIRDFGINTWLAALLVILVAIVIGMINGFITVKFGIPSFITTLGNMMFLRGLTLVISNAWPISGLPQSSFYSVLGGELLGIPLQGLWFVVFAAIGYIILHKSKYGFKVQATGGNKEAARLSGINTQKVKIIGFILTSIAATIASLTAFAFLHSVSPTSGYQMEMHAIAASVVGGTFLFGGSGFIIGTFLGATIIGVVKNGLVILGTTAYLQEAMLGLLIIVAVIINTRFSRSRR